jgi:hypothetical protein
VVRSPLGRHWSEPHWRRSEHPWRRRSIGSPFRNTSTSSFSRLLSRRSCTSSAASARRRSIAEADPAAALSSRHVFSCVGVPPSSAATPACVAPGSDSRATARSSYSGENRRLVCFVISSLQVGICFTARSGIREQRQTTKLATAVRDARRSTNDETSRLIPCASSASLIRDLVGGFPLGPAATKMPRKQAGHRKATISASLNKALANRGVHT